MKQLGFLLSLFIVGTPALLAFAPEVETLLVETERVQETYYRSTTAEMKSLLPSLIRQFSDLRAKTKVLAKDLAGKLYLEMRLDYLLATLYEKESSNAKDERSRDLLMPYHEYASDWLANPSVTSDERRILADILLRTTTWLSLGKTIDSAGKAKELVERAIEQDGGNVWAMLTRAQLYFFTPGIAGGSTKKARELFDRSVDVAKEKGDEYAQFIAGVWLSQWASKQKDTTLYTQVWNSLKEGKFRASWFLDETKALNEKGKVIGG